MYGQRARSPAAMGLIPAGAYTNRDYLGARVRFGDAVPEALRDVCYDPQTSGGLLIALREDEAPKLLQELQAAGVAAEMTGCRVVQLRASPRASGPRDTSIYRYDQSALMAAIAGGQG